MRQQPLPGTFAFEVLGHDLAQPNKGLGTYLNCWDRTFTESLRGA